MKLAGLFDELDGELAARALRHASWAARRADSYDRLAFLGDSVLGLAVTSELCRRLDQRRYGAGRLTEIRARAVNGPACRAVAERLGVGERLLAAAPQGERANANALLGSERVLASVVEAMIGACYLQFGYEPVAEAVVEAFAYEIDAAIAAPGDAKTALQELLSRRGQELSYALRDSQGPPHARTFEVGAVVDGEELARGSGSSLKRAETEAARRVLLALGEPARPQRTG